MRKANLVQTGIWIDEDFLRLSADARYVYLMLCTQPDVGATGRVPMAFTAWCHQTGLSNRRVVCALGELAEHGFTWDDPQWQEVIIRSWIKHNVASSPSMVRAAIDQYPHIKSARLKERLAAEYPTLFAQCGQGVGQGVGDSVDREVGNHGRRGKRSKVVLHPSSLDIENEEDSTDGHPAIGLLLDAMGEPRVGQARLELQALVARGASEYDLRRIASAVEKRRPRDPRAYVRRSLEKSIADRNKASA